MKGREKAREEVITATLRDFDPQSVLRPAGVPRRKSLAPPSRWLAPRRRGTEPKNGLGASSPPGALKGRSGRRPSGRIRRRKPATTCSVGGREIRDAAYAPACRPVMAAYVVRSGSPYCSSTVSNGRPSGQSSPCWANRSVHRLSDPIAGRTDLFIVRVTLLPDEQVCSSFE